MTKKNMVINAGKDLARELWLLERAYKSNNRESIDKHKIKLESKLDIVYRSGLMEYDRYVKILEELKKI